MPSNPNDTVGANYVSVGGMLGQQQDAAGVITSNTLTWPNSTYAYTWPNSTYAYTWPYTPDAEAREKIAALEGEVKVLRAMVAALIAGRTSTKSAPRKRAKK